MKSKSVADLVRGYGIKIRLPGADAVARIKIETKV